MCKLHFERAGWHHLWASLAHTRTAPRGLACSPILLSNIPLPVPMFPMEETHEATEEQTNVLYAAAVLK